MTFTWWKQDNKTEDIESEETQDIIGPEPEEDNDQDDDADIDIVSENEEEMRNDKELVCAILRIFTKKRTELRCTLDCTFSVDGARLLCFYAPVGSHKTFLLSGS